MPLSVTSYIPHRPPFLWVDEIIQCTSNTIETSKYFSEDLDILKGHYPGNPVVPGVILCEAIFQSGAILMGNVNNDVADDLTPVLTRIEKAKFKRMVKPGETATIKVTVIEILSSVVFFKGKLYVDDKLAVSVEFSCAQV